MKERFKKTLGKLTIAATTLAMVVPTAAMFPTQTFASDYNFLPVTLDSDISLSSPEKETHYFTFTPEESGNYTFYSSDLHEADPTAKIYKDEDCLDYVASGDDEDEYNFVITSYLEEGTPYYFVVETFDPGDFTVHLEKAVDDDDEEDNNILHDFIPLTEGQGVTMSYDDTEGFFSFTPDVSADYRIYSYNTDDNVDPWANLYSDNELEDLIMSGDDDDLNDFSITEYLEAGKTYYLRVSSWDNTGGFSFMVVNAENDPGTGDEDDYQEVSVTYVCKDADGNVIKEFEKPEMQGESIWAVAPYMDGYVARTSGRVVEITEEGQTIEFIYDKIVNISKASVSGIKASYAYTGKALTPKVTVKSGSTTLKNDVDYTVEYKSNKTVGTATVTINGKGLYTGKITKTFNITKASQPAKVTVAKKTVKYSKTKKKAQTVSGAIKVTKAQGKVTYTRVAKGSSKNLTINKTTGKITVKKGTPKGSYKIKVKVKSAGNKNFKSGTKTVTATVVVK